MKTGQDVVRLHPYAVEQQDGRIRTVRTREAARLLRKLLALFGKDATILTRVEIRGRVSR